MRRPFAEMEFEFRPGHDGGEFLACGRVVQRILDRLAADDLKEAVRLYTSCAEDVGEDLLESALGAGASQRTIAALAEMFAAARDFRRAALCAERSGKPELAAKAFEEGYELEAAAEAYLKAKNPRKAAQLYERALQFDKAAELYWSLQDLPQAAENLERSEDYFGAGRIYMKMSQWNKAIDVFQKVPGDGDEFALSRLLSGQILENMSNQKAALRAYAQVVSTRPIDKETVEIHFRLASLCVKMKNMRQARNLIKGVLSVNPKHEGALEVVETLKRDEQCRTTLNAANQVKTIDDSRDASELSGSMKPQDRMVGVDPDFEFLRRVPLFAQLSLDELKYASRMCEKVKIPPGKPLIEQGQPGQALYVLARGRAEVLTRAADGTVKPLVVLTPGAHVGEMSLLDNAPTSATVMALDEVTAYRLSATRFRELIQANERIQLRIYRVLVKTLLTRLREANAA
jgi:tetratricopeptide (TPR) repeat protein